MRVSLDYPNLRQTSTCPLCHDEKQIGCVVCWRCFPVIKNGTSKEVETILQVNDAIRATIHNCSR